MLGNIKLMDISHRLLNYPVSLSNYYKPIAIFTTDLDPKDRQKEFKSQFSTTSIWTPMGTFCILLLISGTLFTLYVYVPACLYCALRDYFYYAFHCFTMRIRYGSMKSRK